MISVLISCTLNLVCKYNRYTDEARYEVFAVRYEYADTAESYRCTCLSKQWGNVAKAKKENIAVIVVESTDVVKNKGKI